MKPIHQFPFFFLFFFFSRSIFPRPHLIIFIADHRLSLPFFIFSPPMTDSTLKNADLYGILNPVQKRARTQLSCTACRSGKLKCNRISPCNQCTRRGREDSCQYLAPPIKKKPNQGMKERVKNLERLVIHLIEEQTAPETSTPPEPVVIGSPVGPSDSPETKSDPPSVPQPEDSLKRDKHGGTSYVNSSHWTSILQDVGIYKKKNFNHSRLNS